MNKLTKSQESALVRFSKANFGSPSTLGIRRDVAERLVDGGFVTSTGAWKLTDLGLAHLAKLKGDPS